jgi:hypothetical protein
MKQVCHTETAYGILARRVKVRSEALLTLAAVIPKKAAKLSMNSIGLFRWITTAVEASFPHQDLLAKSLLAPLFTNLEFKVSHRILLSQTGLIGLCFAHRGKIGLCGMGRCSKCVKAFLNPEI